ncbi:hypothetical protein [Xanthobacter sediminis]
MENLPTELQAAATALSDNDAGFRAQARGFERLLLLEVLREADMVGYARAFDPKRRIPGAPGHLDLVWLGLAHAVDLLTPEAMKGPGMVWEPARPERTAWAMGFLRRSAMVSQFRRLVQLLRYDLAAVEVLGPRAFGFRIHAQDLEAHDRDAMAWFASRTRRQHASLLGTFREVHGAAVAAELQARVGSDPRFGIRYSSSRELEECFEFEAELRAAELGGNDCLPETARLGPLTFGDYRRVVVAGMARSFKHVAFLETLLRLEPKTPHTALTIFAEERILKEQWGGLLGLDDATSVVLLNVLGLTPEDLPELRRTGDCPQPLLVRGGDTFWHKPVYAGLNNPFGWVTTKLRRVFRSDWDRAVDGREAQFRDDLRHLFPENRFWFAPAPVNIRAGGRVLTDVDAIVVDRASHTAAVFQLKWQDIFGSGLAERASRRRNLIKEGNAWIEVLSDYLSGETPAAAAARLGVPASEARDVRAVHLFVLTRNAAKFSGPNEQDRRAAWLSWFDLVRRCHDARQYLDPFSRISRAARRAPRSAMSRDTWAFEIDGFRVEVIHEPSVGR